MRSVGTAEAKRDIKAALLSNCRAMLALPGAQFGFADMARVMGSRVSERELRTALERMTKSKHLARPSRGRYAAGPSLDDDLSAGATVSNDLREAFYWAGGVLETPEILISIGRQDDARARLARAALRDSETYEKSIPVNGFRNHWIVRDKERRTIPLRGPLHILDLQLTLMQLADGHVSWRYGIEKSLSLLRKRIGRGLRDARALFDLEPADMAMRIADVFEKNLAEAVTRHSDDKSPGAWWRSMESALGRDDALAVAWTLLESDEPPHIASFLEIDFWLAVSDSTGLDAAMLSRGALIHAVSGDPAVLEAVGF